MAQARALDITGGPQHTTKQSQRALSLALPPYRDASYSLPLLLRIPQHNHHSRSPIHRSPATMSSGEVLKADKDFSKETDAAIPEAEKLGAVGVIRARAVDTANSRIRAIRKPASTTCLPSRRRRARYTTSVVAHTSTRSQNQGLRSRVDLPDHHRHRHHSQAGK
jgi:hypothetical protein